MKKINLTVILLFVVNLLFAQWSTNGSKIYYNGGNVGIGTSNPGQKLHINGSIKGPGHGLLKIQTNSGYLEMGPANSSYTHFLTDRPNFYFKGESFFFDNPIGGATNMVTLSSYDENLALKTSFGSNYGVLISNTGYVTIRGALPNPSISSGMHVWGSVAATAYYSFSDKKFKKNIQEIPDSGEILKRIIGHKYELIADLIETDDELIGSKFRYGVIAQEVKEILPEAVSGEEGNYGVNYDAFIPILIEAYKAQQITIEQQQKKIDQIANVMASNNLNKIAILPNFESILYQNNPNPFNSNTFIEYSIADNAKADLFIYDLQGKQIKKYPLLGNNNRVEIIAGELRPGTYIYTLISDNKVIDSKRMILTD